MLASSLFIVVPVALALVVFTPSSASPTMVKHHVIQNKTKPMTTARTEMGPMPRRTRAKHIVVERGSLDDPSTVALDVSLRQLSLDHNRVRSASNAFGASSAFPDVFDNPAQPPLQPPRRKGFTQNPCMTALTSRTAPRGSPASVKASIASRTSSRHSALTRDSPTTTNPTSMRST